MGVSKQTCVVTLTKRALNMDESITDIWGEVDGEAVSENWQTRNGHFHIPIFGCSAKWDTWIIPRRTHW